MFDKEIAEKHLKSLLKKYKIKVEQWSKSSGGWAMARAKKVKIPHPTDVDRFCVCMHEIHHILNCGGGTKLNRFQEEFDADYFAMEQATLLGFDTIDWKFRMRWHSLSRIAMSMNRNLSASKIPEYIKNYFNDINFSDWEGKNVFVSSIGQKCGENLQITINEKVKRIFIPVQY